MEVGIMNKFAKDLFLFFFKDETMFLIRTPSHDGKKKERKKAGKKSEVEATYTPYINAERGWDGTWWHAFWQLRREMEDDESKLVLPAVAEQLKDHWVFHTWVKFHEWPNRDYLFYKSFSPAISWCHESCFVAEVSLWCVTVKKSKAFALLLTNIFSRYYYNASRVDRKAKAKLSKDLATEASSIL